MKNEKEIRNKRKELEELYETIQYRPLGSFVKMQIEFFDWILDD